MSEHFVECSAARFLGSEADPASRATPHLAISLPGVRWNLERVLDAIGDPACWRPHLKTTKLPELWKLMLEAGLERFKCSTTLELANLLAIAPDVDCLLAHHLDDAGMRTLEALAGTYPAARISTLVEAPEDVDRLPAGIEAFVDVNPGMNRTGIRCTEPERILEVIRACGARWRGIHFYDGHVRNGTEQARRAQAHAGYDLLLGLDHAAGGADELITSGTPTFLHALTHSALVGTMRHAVSPGTVVLHDGMSERLPEIATLGLEPAAAVVATVVSHPDDAVATVNAGSKAIAAETGDPCCTVLEHPSALPLRPSEEHLPIRFEDASARPSRGTVLALVPEHVCPTVNLARTILLVDDGVTRVVDNVSGGHAPPVEQGDRVRA
ncbi:MAG: alanine racemase [Planctomycetota bacterium]|nr:alanine racemase [Planctomycetota bacterium]